MDPTVLGILGIAGLFFLLATGMYIGMAMFLVGFLGYCFLMGLSPGLGLLSGGPW